MSINLYIKLPAGIIENLRVTSSLNVHFLKFIIEKNFGVPCELQRLEFNGITLIDHDVLHLIGITECSEITVDVDIWWAKLVALCLRGNNANLLYRRVSVPMQHIGEINRVFISLFVSATRGFYRNVANLLSNYKTFDLKSATNVTGRTVLHAAVSSGRLECVEAIKKHAGKDFERLLYLKDNQNIDAVDELTMRNEHILTYINRFISIPITQEEVINNSTKALHFMNRKDLELKNDDLESGKVNNRKIGENDKSNDILVVAKGQIEALSSAKSSNNVGKDVAPKLSRSKQDNYATLPESIFQTMGNNSHGNNPGSPTTNETNEHIINIPINESSDENVGQCHLPMIKNNTGGSISNISPSPPRSPRRMSKTLITRPHTAGGSTSQSNPSQRREGSDTLTIPTLEKKTTLENKKKVQPVAGVLKESNLRKFSAARRPCNYNNSNLTLPSPVPYLRAKSAEPPTDNTHLMPQQPPERPSSAGKVRRVSLLQKHPVKPPSPSKRRSRSDENVDDLVVFTMEEDRIEKPWNNWIKAVTIDADSEEGKELLKSPPVERNRKISNIQAASRDEEHNKSFDEWCRYKAQEQLVQQEKLKEAKDEKEREAINSRFGKLGKTFEQWLKEKQLYESLLKQQQHEDEKENRKPRKLLKGKTFEEWQKEIEEKERNQSDLKKLQKVKDVEQKASKERRRKESTVKYQQWLAEKEKQEIEKDLKEFQSLVNRKKSVNKPADDLKGTTNKIVT